MKRLAFAWLALASLLAACSHEPESRTLVGPTMGTTYHVTVARMRGPEDEEGAQACVDSVLHEIDRHLSTYRADSEISLFNRSAATGWIPVSTTLYSVIETARRVGDESGGAFDITVGPLVRLWGFGEGAGTNAAALDPPEREFILDAQAAVGYRWLEQRTKPAPAVRKERVPLELDVDGIAPGYAVDRISDCLAQRRLPDHLVEIGGEVRARGRRADGRPWQVAVEAPVAGEREAYAGLQLADLAVSTSGDYRDARRLRDGRVVSHTIDPRTGEPVSHGLVSVTVVHPRAVDADAYATALMVLGPQEGYALAQKLGLPVLMLERTAQPGVWKEYVTPGFTALRRPAG